MNVYYNEFDKKKCAALAQLMKDGHISKGDIDDRSIRDVKPEDVRGYDRCHFFAGIGLWDYALQLAGWADTSPVWTGSCPCQPFSSAGRQKGKTDDRHLWPVWQRLIAECRPATVFGEQVASAIAHGWLDDVYQGLEQEDYAVGSVVLPACSVGAPHRRDRLWFVANAAVNGREQSDTDARGCGEGICAEQGAMLGDNSQSDVAYPSSERLEGTTRESIYGRSTRPTRNCSFDVVNTINEGSQGHTRYGKDLNRQGWINQESSGSAWSSGIWIDCPDGKQRLVEPSIPLLAHGHPERVGIIHCAGDAIVAQVAAEFIRATMP